MKTFLYKTFTIAFKLIAIMVFALCIYSLIRLTIETILS